MGIGRIIDANINRCFEGLRVIEDIYRFYNYKNLSDGIRTIRHSVIKIRKELILVTADRNINADYGKNNIPSNKKDIEEIVFSNFSRVKESLRVIEELVSNDNIRTEIQKLRFAIYNEEQKFIKNKSISLIKNIYPIITDPIIGYKKFTEEIISAGATVVQLRMKKDTDIEVFKIALQIRDIIPDDVLYIIDDRPDICMAVEGDGVHVGQYDLSVHTVRNIIGPGKIVGKSTHNMNQVEKAKQEVPDYIGIGPIYPTNSKENPDAVLGLEKAKSMVSTANTPTVCIGGINDTNIRDVKNLECSAIAVLSYLTKSKEPGKKFEKLKSLIDN